MKKEEIVSKLKDSNFSLVLSGGGALGIAHLGVIRDLERLLISPDEIIGTSMGGIIGACLAVGMQEEEIFAKIENFASVGNWIKLSLKGNSIIKSSKISAIFEEIFGDLRMSQTKIPLKLISTNLLSGQKRVFDSKDKILIKDALLCTMAIPGIFEEQIIDDEVLGDGFLCENLGVREASFERILAVDVMGYDSFFHQMPKNFFKSVNVLEMFERSMRLLIFNQTQTLLESVQKEIFLISPKTKDYKTYHFHKAKEIRELGKLLD
jgi:NTE family protein